MFELPEAKRVRREDLKDSDNSDLSDDGDFAIDADLQALLNAQIARSLGLDEGKVESLNRAAEDSEPRIAKPGVEQTDSTQNGIETRDTNQENEDLGEFEFRLFSSATAAPKVVLENDNVAQGEGGFVAKRPSSYFLAKDVPPELKRQYELAAVSGEEVLGRSRWRRWGLELPWKVTSIITTKRKARPGGDGTEPSVIVEAAEPSKRRRPGKKTRIARRTRERAKEAKEEAAMKKQMDKEEHLRDKKKRLNRAKKLRKRAKDKGKKMAAKEGETAGSDVDD